MFMRQSFRKSTAIFLLLAALPGTALAHPDHDVGANLMAGLLHPLTGLDHVLMIIAVSAWAALLAPTGRVAVAASLAVFVGIGALLPVRGSAALEAAIALTVIGSGILLAMGRRWPLWATGALAACFALIHGFAHGAEGPGRSLTYIAGLLLATATLALFVSSMVSRLKGSQIWLRGTGIATTALGIAGLTS